MPNWSSRAGSTPVCTTAGWASLRMARPPLPVSRPVDTFERANGAQNSRSALDSEAGLVDCLSVDRRMLPGAVVGGVGLLLGVAGVLLSSPILGLIAGLFALGGGLVAIAETRRVQEAETAAASAVDAVTLRHLELFTSARDRSLVDDETGLPDQRFFELALEGRVAAARRHLWPVTLVLVELELDIPPGDEHAEAEALASFSVLVRRTLREADIACRISPTRFGMILEDTAEEGAD